MTIIVCQYTFQHYNIIFHIHWVSTRFQLTQLIAMLSNLNPNQYIHCKSSFTWCVHLVNPVHDIIQGPIKLKPVHIVPSFNGRTIIICRTPITMHSGEILFQNQRNHILMPDMFHSRLKFTTYPPRVGTTRVSSTRPPFGFLRLDWLHVSLCHAK